MRSCGTDNLLPITHPMLKSHRPIKWRTLPPMIGNLLEIILYQRTSSNERIHQFFSKSVCRNISKISRQGGDACTISHPISNKILILFCGIPRHCRTVKFGMLIGNHYYSKEKISNKKISRWRIQYGEK